MGLIEEPSAALLVNRLDSENVQIPEESKEDDPRFVRKHDPLSPHTMR